MLPSGPTEASLKGAPDGGHIACVVAEPFEPRGQVSFSNASETVTLESEVCAVKWLWLHKPTDNSSRLESGDYPYSDHMHGRKRLWEMRAQIVFKKPVDGNIFVGIELDQFHKKSALQRYLGESLKAALRHVTGGVYNSDGDDPQTTAGEAERPAIMFPLTLMDQLIITPEGEEPPDLTSALLPSLGMIRAQNRQAFKKAIQALHFQPGPTYTVGLWCISQFADAIQWTSPPRGPFPRIKFKDLEFHTPGYVVAYKLSDCDKQRRERRHLDSMKEYLFRMAFWGTGAPPAPERIRELVVRHTDDAPSACEEDREKLARDCCSCGVGVGV